ncbi:MAG: HAMP domain-containing sensor histidine kinase [Hyphomicrobiaceae bacterium]
MDVNSRSEGGAAPPEPRPAVELVTAGVPPEEGRTQRVRAAVAPPLRSGLSWKLLLLTIAFVMLAEVLIFLPSVANFRVTWLMQRLEVAQIASLAAEAAPGGVLPQMLREEILKTADVRGIALKRQDQRLLVLSENMPPVIDEYFDLRTASAYRKIVDAVEVYFSSPDRIIRVVGRPEMGVGDFIEIVMSEAALRSAMIRYGFNILGLSVIISMLAASLVYLALHRLMVRPMRRLTESMIRFRLDPENAGLAIHPSGRHDEIGIAEEKLSQMQLELVAMLRQKSHLAALGLAVSKINHDLRNMLANAQLISDRLGSVPDPTVQRVTPKLIQSLDRAIRLCTETLSYGRASEAPLERRHIPLRPLVEEVGESLGLPRPGAIDWRIAVAEDLIVDADPDQLYRVLANLARNSVQVLEGAGGAHAIRVEAHRKGDAIVIDLADDGPGVPEHARRNLFVPFHGSGRVGGTGLGLAIVAELVHAHGGRVALIDGGEPGARFRIVIPDRQQG